MIEAGLAMLAALAAGTAWRFWNLWRRRGRALAEWAARWETAIELCAMPGCLRPREADCHVTEEFRNTGRTEKYDWHRFIPARVVPAPVLWLREGIGRDR